MSQKKPQLSDDDTQLKTAKITYPGHGVRADRQETVRGTSTGLKGSERLWIVVRMPSMGGRFYPPGEPVEFLDGGDWTRTIYLGGPSDGGTEFDVVAMTFDKRGEKSINKYVKQAKRREHWPGIEKEKFPRGSRTLDQVTVTRK